MSPSICDNIAAATEQTAPARPSKPGYTSEVMSLEPTPALTRAAPIKPKMQTGRDCGVECSTIVELSRCAAEGSGCRWHGLAAAICREVALTQGHPSRLIHINYPSITKFQQLVELKDYRQPTKKEPIRYVRKLVEHFQCDPAPPLVQG